MVVATRQRRNNTSVSQEDYLKAIWEMEQEEQEPISARWSEVLGVTPPAVTAALTRMARADGLLLPRSRARKIELRPVLIAIMPARYGCSHAPASQ